MPVLVPDAQTSFGLEWVVLDVDRAMVHGARRGWPEHVAERERRRMERDRPGLKFVLRMSDGSVLVVAAQLDEAQAA